MAINISYSLLAEYLSCQRKPLYRLRFPELSIPNKEMHIGSAVHIAIEKFSNDRKSAENYALDYMDINNVTAESDRQYAIDCLSGFFDGFAEHLTDSDEIEVKFKIPLAGHNAFLVGKIDRISDGKIFDWKTSRNPPSKLINDLQFIIYNWAYTQLYKKPPIASYYGALIQSRLIQHRVIGDAETYVFYELIPQVILSIKNNVFPHTGVFTKACFRCPYSSTCLKEDIDVLDNRTFTS